jgi:LacI family transcriptional regulator
MARESSGVAPPSLALIARHAGVAKSTVSRALNGNPMISAAMRAKIVGLAESLGFRPNPYLKILMARTREGGRAPYRATLAWIDCSERAEGVEINHVSRGFYHGAKARAESLGFHLETFAAHARGMSTDRLGDILAARGIHGALLAMGAQYDELGRPPPVRLDRLAAVQVGMRSALGQLNFSINDSLDTARQAHRHLRALGYRRVGFCTTPDVEGSVGQGFLAGYASVLLEIGELPPAPVYFHGAAVAQPWDLGSWVRAHQLDAILYTYWPGLRAELKRARLAVPGTLGLATTDWDEATPEVAGMDQRHGRVAATAVDLLNAQLEGSHFGPQAVPRGAVNRSVWRDGASAPLRLAVPVSARGRSPRFRG